MGATRHAKRFNPIMVSDEFNPIDHARPPREKGFKEETEKIAEILHNRGDQRIGQLLINAVSKEVKMPERPEREKDVTEMDEEEAAEYIEELRIHEEKCKARIERKIWSIEADRLLELLQDFQEEDQE